MRSSGDDGATRTADSVRPIHVLIATGNEVLRAGIVTLLQRCPGFAAAEAAAGAGTLVHEVGLRRPDIVLVNVSAAGRLRGQLDARGRTSVGDVAVVGVVTDDDADLSLLQQVGRCGVAGIIAGYDETSLLVSALRTLHAGHRWLSPTIGGNLLGDLAELGPAPGPGEDPVDDAGRDRELRLTPRERRVLAFVADGLTVGQIASRLNRSESTVKYHLSNMGARYQSRNRAHLVFLAVRSGELLATS